MWVDDEAWQIFVGSGQAYDIEPRLADVVEFARRSRVLLLKHVTSGVPNDLSLGALPFERELLERVQTINVGGVRLRVPTIEDLIITKAVAQRGKDIADIESLLSTADTLDLGRVRFWTNQFFEALDAQDMNSRLETLLVRFESK